MNDTRENEIAALRVIHAGKLKSKDANRMMEAIDAWYLDIIFTKERLVSTCLSCEREFRYKIPRSINCGSCKWIGKNDDRCKDCKEPSGFPVEWEHKCPVCDRKKSERRKRKTNEPKMERIEMKDDDDGD